MNVFLKKKKSPGDSSYCFQDDASKFPLQFPFRERMKEITQYNEKKRETISVHWNMLNRKDEKSNPARSSKTVISKSFILQI